MSFLVHEHLIVELTLSAALIHSADVLEIVEDLGDEDTSNGEDGSHEKCIPDRIR